MDEISITQALQELDATLAVLLAQSNALSSSGHAGGISCRRHWNPAVKTFTYHTHIVVPHIDPESINTLSHLFFNAYSLQQHGWYSQFVRGTNHPLPFMTDKEGEHQLGQGYFDFGVGALRRYHLLFSRLQVDAKTHAVILRSVPETTPALPSSRQVFILPPTGDIFSLDDAGLHWHHICTTSGVRLLPDPFDRWLMNALRALRLDGKERKTYVTEAQAFARFATTVAPFHAQQE